MMTIMQMTKWKEALQKVPVALLTFQGEQWKAQRWWRGRWRCWRRRGGWWWHFALALTHSQFKSIDKCMYRSMGLLFMKKGHVCPDISVFLDHTNESSNTSGNCYRKMALIYTLYIQDSFEWIPIWRVEVHHERSWWTQTSSSSSCSYSSSKGNAASDMRWQWKNIIIVANVNIIINAMIIINDQ